MNRYLTILLIGFFTPIALQLSAQCPGLGSITLNVIPAPQPVLNAPAALCTGVAGVVSVTTAFDSYLWSTGETGQSISINGPGTYSVVVSNAGACTGEASVTVAASPTPTPNISQNTYACNGQVTLDAGAGFSTYTWSNSGGSNPTATYTNPGPYTVTVTNAGGCTATDEFNVVIPAPPVVSISGTLSFCSGESTTLNATPGFSGYSWTGGSGTPSLNVTTGGTYTVTVTDAFGCTDTETATVTTNPSPVPLVAGGQVCPGNNFSLVVSNAPFSSYNWTGGGSSSNILVGVGTYTVTVTAANGCTGTTSASVTNFAAPNPVITPAAYACNGQITLNAGGGFSSYSWSNTAMTPGITVSNSGVFTVTVTDGNGCTGTDNFNVTIPTPPAVSITGDNSFCDGLSANLDATPGFASYTWSNTQNGAGISVVNGGTYTVTATDNFGCTATSSFTTAVLPAPQPVITGAASVCSGIFTTLSTAAPFSSYAWSNAQFTPTISVGTANTYTVTVTAANGCTGTDSQVLTVTPAPVPVISEATYLCDEQLTLVVPGGFNIYNWSTSASTPSIVVNTTNTYTVTVTNAAGCTGTNEYFAIVPTAPFVEITGAATFCPGNSSTLSATPGFNNYVWSTAEFSASIAVAAPGNYTVTVTDGFGCTTTDAFSVSSLNAPVANISGPSQICASGSATFSVPGTFSSISWSTGASTPTITVNTPATYTVTVTAANGCTATDTQVLTVSNSLQPQITESPYNCDGIITLDAGGGFALYAWSGAETTQSIDVTADNTYTVTVSDAGGCTGTAAYAVTVPQAPIVAISGNNNICGGTTSTITATPGFNAYIWNTAQVGNTITVSTAGTYTVTATDVFGCTTSAQYVVNTVPAPVAVITGPAVICTGSSGTLGLAGSFMSYLWNTAATTATIDVTTAGTYTVTVTNAAGCTGTDNQTVTEATGLSPAVVQLPYTCNGSQTLDAGVGYTSYSWSGSETTATITTNTGGTYTVTVTDATGCTGSSSIDIIIPVVPVVSISGVNSFCQNSSTTLTATAGFASYLWTGGFTTEAILASSSGTYTVTVTDSDGCTDTENITVTAQPLPTPVILGPTAICGGNNITFTLGQTFTSYAWSDGSSAPSLTVNTGGTYTVIVTDANGCTETDDIVVSANTAPSPTITPQAYNCDGQITLDASAGFDIYAWSNAGNTASITLNMGGTYTVTVTDVNGCTGTAIQDVTIPAVSQVTISGPLQFCAAGSADLLGSAGFTTYSWSNATALQGITVTTPGTYTVTATDAVGCTSTASATTSQFPTPMPAISGPLTVCPGNTATLGTVGTFVNYAWNTGETTLNITVQPPFTGTVTVTDANGCTATATATVGVSNQLSPSITPLPYNCDGQITLDAGAGFPNYAWSNTDMTATTIVSQSGTYTVTVSDNGGCSGMAEIQVTVPVISTVTITGDAEVCIGATAILNASTGFVSYEWSTTETTPTIQVNSGVYDVTATDALGCTTVATATLSEFAAPVPVITGPLTVCPGNDATLDAGAFATYLWSNGETTASITVQPPFTGSVTVTDANGCTATATATVSVSNQLSPSITPLPYNCDGQITLDAGAGFPNYAWSNAGVSATTIVSQSGTYTVTVSDNGGCSGTAEIQVTVPVISTVTITGDAEVCIGATGTLSASTGFVSYEWSTTETTPTIQVNSGVYTVTATDAAGCTTVTTATLSEFAAPVPVITGPLTVCPGNNATLDAGAFAAYLWSNGETTASITVQPPFTGTVTVTDANGCTGTATATVSVSNQLSPSITPLPYNCDGQITLDAGAGFPNYAWSNAGVNATTIVSQSGTYTVTVSDNGGCSGTAEIQVTVPTLSTVSITGDTQLCPSETTTLSASAGFSFYIWSNGETTADIDLNAGGSYTVTTTDALGCTTTTTVTVNSLTSPVVVINGPTAICGTDPATLSVDPSFSIISWSNAASTPDISITSPGTYTVTVTDANGCTASASTNIISTSLTPALQSNEVFCEGTSVTLVVSGIYDSYTWSNGATESSVMVSVVGFYTVTVTDINGCTGTATSEVLAVPPATVAISGNNVLCGGSTSLSTFGSVGDFDWSNGATGDLLTITTPGTYTVTVTDPNGCSATDSITIQSGGAPSATTVNRVTCREQDAGTVVETLTATSGCDSVVTTITTYLAVKPGLALDLGPDITIQSAQEISFEVIGNFQIDSVAFESPFQLSCENCLNPSLTPGSSGTIRVIAFDADGCITADEVEVILRKKLDIYIPNTFQPGSADNGYFTVFSGPEISFVRNFNVYDRWGNAMFSRDDLPTNDPTAGWDGTFRNKKMPPGVYVYYFEVILADGTKVVYSGDITIVE